MDKIENIVKDAERLREKAREECAIKGHAGSDYEKPWAVSGKRDDAIGTFSCERCGENYMKKISPKEYDSFWKQLPNIPIGIRA